MADGLNFAVSQADAFSIIEETLAMDETVIRLRDLLGVGHLVYHSSRLGVSPSVDPYIRLTYPASWIKRYLERGYVDVDPVLRAGFQRTLPFDWSELTVDTPEGGALLLDALEHGIGPNGLSIPLRSKQGHRGLFSMCDSGERDEWERFRRGNLPVLIEIGNRLHRRVIAEAFGEDHPHLTQREVECLHWVSLGKEASDIAKILNISPHTARDYLKSARFKLDSVTSAQAVTKAVRLGLLTL
jgi:LuxR family transcriptional regulator, quorum-sensing system regulator CinR